MRYCLILDLKDDPALIAKYLQYHQEVWPEVIQRIKVSGIQSMEIYHMHTRLVMILETAPDFSFERKSQADLATPRVQEWEHLMDTYQQRLPFAKTDEKWVLMDKIFQLD